MADVDRNETIIVSVTDAYDVVKGTVTFNMNTHSILVDSEPSSQDIEDLLSTIVEFFGSIRS